jgi:hypothetical protein
VMVASSGAEAFFMARNERIILLAILVAAAIYARNSGITFDFSDAKAYRDAVSWHSGK